MDEIRFLKPYRFRCTDPVLIDVGAHHGYVALSFAEMGWRVLAFEPEAGNRAKFAHNLQHYSNVRCIPNAVSNVTGEKVPFFVSREHYGIHSLRPWHATHQAEYEVETVRLDDVLPAHDIRNVTVLKVDIEGADFLALQGFDFSRYSPELVMTEFMDSRTGPNFGYTHHDMAAFMKGQGYAAFVSEWSPLTGYAREGVDSAPTTEWLRFVPYTPEGTPAWGNLFFVPKAESARFARAIAVGVRREKRRLLFSRLARMIPGARYTYRKLKGGMRAFRHR